MSRSRSVKRPRHCRLRDRERQVSYLDFSDSSEDSGSETETESGSSVSQQAVYVPTDPSESESLYSWNDDASIEWDEELCNEVQKTRRLSGEERVLVLSTIKSCLNLTGRAASIVTELTNLFVPAGEQLVSPSDVFYYCNHLFNQLKPVLSYYCFGCKQLLQSELDSCMDEQCRRFEARTGLSSDTRCVQLLTLSIRPQLEQLIRLHINDLLTADNGARERTTFVDIHDGSLYKHTPSWNNGILTIKLIIGQDACGLARKSNVHLLPIMLKVANLSRNIRAKYENTIFAAFWISSTAETWYDLLYERLLSEMDQINTRNYSVKLSDGQRIPYKVRLIMLVADGGERPKILNMHLANQYFACHLCLHPGRWDARAHFVSYLPLSDPDNGEVMVPALRTQTSYRQTITDLETAVHLQSSSQTQTPSHISGIRGRSLIIDALECGIQGVCIDIMHAKDEGIYTKLQDVVLGSGNVEWDMRWALDEINDAMNRIKYPTYMQRVCRSFVDNKLYTASERRNCWELLMPVILHRTLAERDVDRFHFILCLLIGLRSLSLREISLMELDIAQTLVSTFSELVSTFGDPRWGTIKLHLLSHIQLGTKRCGNLVNSAMNEFESGLHFLKQNLKGPMGLCRQIGFRTLIRRQLFLQLEELTQKKQTPQLLSIFKLLSTTSSFVPAGATQFSDNILVTRAYASKAMTAQERRILRKIDPKLATQSEVVVFRRIVVGHVIVAGRLDWNKPRKSECSLVTFKNQQKETCFGEVMRLIRSSTSDRIWALVRQNRVIGSLVSSLQQPSHPLLKFHRDQGHLDRTDFWAEVEGVQDTVVDANTISGYCLRIHWNQHNYAIACYDRLLDS